MTLLQEAASLKKTPLYDRHVALNGKIVDFSGWALPVYYSGILAEHKHTREACGVFDVSHLGEIRVKGPGAARFLQYRLTNDLGRLADGRMQYHLLCDERGRTLDDVLVYRESAEDFYVVVNASNVATDLEALRRYAPDAVAVEDRSDSTSCIAAQGPRAEAALREAFGWDLSAMRYYSFRAESFAGAPVWVSRSGYTGEDGFEIFSDNATAPKVWDALVGAGPAAGVLPCGLGARNTLRLEAGNPLYGHEITRETTPLEGGLGFAVSFTKEGGFVGRDLMLLQKEQGPARRIAGFRVLDKAVVRDGAALFRDAKRVGTVTSGSFAPTVGGPVGLALVQKGSAEPGTALEAEVHGRRVPVEIVKTPFVPLNHRNKKG